MTNTIMKDRFVEVNSAISNEINEKGIENGLLSHFNQVAGEFPDGKFPSGLTAEQTAQAIVNSVTSYVNARDAQLVDGAAYDENAVREIIVERAKDMTDEQKTQYLAGLSLYLKYSGRTDVTTDILVQEYNNLLGSCEGLDHAEVNDKLLDSLDFSKANNAVEISSRFVNENPDDIPAIVSESISNEFNTLKESVIASATYYTLVSKGELAGIPADQDPGVVAVEYVAFVDSQRVSVLSKENKITEQESNMLYDIINVALTIALTAAVAVIYAFCAFGFLKLMATIAVAIGASVGLAKALVLLGWFLFICLYIDDFSVNSFDVCSEISEKAVSWLQRTIEKFKSKRNLVDCTAVEHNDAYEDEYEYEDDEYEETSDFAACID